MRWIVGALVALLLAGTCAAAIPLTCEQVRANVQKYGVSTALAWARRNGWTEAQISEARRCLR